TTTIAIAVTAKTRSARETFSTVTNLGRTTRLPQFALPAVSSKASRLGPMVEIAAKPRGPYSLALSARLASDATRLFRDGVFTARYAGTTTRAWQSPD